MSEVDEIIGRNKAIFDQVAISYDDTFTFSNIGKFQRIRVYHFLERLLPRNKTLQILEINCGTGEDASWLSRKGHNIIATDASEKMIEVANSKFEIRPVPYSSGNLKFEKCSFNQLKEKYYKQNFDLIFSNFGGLNCVDENELKKLSENFSFLLKPKGKFIAVVMGKKCLWEVFYFMLKFNFTKAFRRFSKNGVNAQIGNTIQKTFYYSPAGLSKIFSKDFRLVKKRPVSLFIPPSYFEPFFKDKKKVFKILEYTERILSFSFLSNFADHYLIAFEKK